VIALWLEHSVLREQIFDALGNLQASFRSAPPPPA
jgi:hypothetical protein